MAPLTLADLREAANRLWPEDTAEPWDQVGLVSGNPGADLSRVLLAVDPVAATVQEAIEIGADVLFVHHPLLLHGAHSVAEDTGKGALLAPLIRGGVALYTAHTNADAPPAGVSSVLAHAIGLQDQRPIEPRRHDPHSGIGRVGTVGADGPHTLGEMADHLARILPETAGGIRVAGEGNRAISRVALCGGAGDSLLEHPEVVASDLFITSDLRHHRAGDTLESVLARGTGPALIDISHWAAESLWLGQAARDLGAALPSIEFVVSQVNTDPWSFTVGSRS